MAELKEEQDFLYPYDQAEVKVTEDPILPADFLEPTPISKPQKTPLLLPQEVKKLKKMVIFERIFIVSWIAVAVMVSFLIMSMGNKITQTKENTIQIEQKNKATKESIEQLTQEKSELSSAKKVKEVANKKGLTLKEENVRNVK